MSGSRRGYLSAEQIRAARGLLNWSQDDLAAAAKLSVATIRKLELGNISPRGETTKNIRSAFEDAGLEFLEPNGVRQRPEEITIYHGHEGAKAFYDDIYESSIKKGGDVINVCPSAKKYFIELLGEYQSTHIERMQAIKETVPVKCILTEEKSYLPASSYAEYRWISKQYVDSVSFYVYDDKYGIILVEPKIKITVIQSRAIADAYRRQFYSMWEKATPLNEPDWKTPPQRKTS